MPLNAPKQVRNELQEDEPEESSGIGWMLAIPALLSVGAGLYFYFGRSRNEPSANTPQSVTIADTKGSAAKGVGAGIVAATQAAESAPPAPRKVSDQIVGFGKAHLHGNLEKLIESVSQGYGDPHLNQSVEGHPLTIGEQKFATGLGTHAFSRIHLALNGKYRRLSGGCGPDMDAGGPSTVAFKILHDKSVLFSTPVKKRGESVMRFNLSVERMPSVDLIVEDGGDGITYDHADWVDLKLE